jgi:hypothetical protein
MLPADRRNQDARHDGLRVLGPYAQLSTSPPTQVLANPKDGVGLSMTSAGRDAKCTLKRGRGDRAPEMLWLTLGTVDQP